MLRAWLRCLRAFSFWHWSRLHHSVRSRLPCSLLLLSFVFSYPPRLQTVPLPALSRTEQKKRKQSENHNRCNRNCQYFSSQESSIGIQLQTKFKCDILYHTQLDNKAHEHTHGPRLSHAVLNCILLCVITIDRQDHFLFSSLFSLCCSLGRDKGCHLRPSPGRKWSRNESSSGAAGTNLPILTTYNYYSSPDSLSSEYKP